METEETSFFLMSEMNMRQALFVSGIVWGRTEGSVGPWLFPKILNHGIFYIVSHHFFGGEEGRGNVKFQKPN